MKPSEIESDQSETIPENAADAWAEVYIDVAEKLDAEEQASAEITNTTTEANSMSKYITGDAELNFPMPSTATLAMQVDAMRRAGIHVTAAALAQHFKLSEGVIKDILRRAENIRLLRNDPNLGWVPVSS